MGEVWLPAMAIPPHLDTKHLTWTSTESCAEKWELQLETYGNLSERDGSWWPLITRLRAMPLLNCVAAFNSFMRKCLLGSAKFLPTYLTSILGQKMQYSKTSLKNR